MCGPTGEQKALEAKQAAFYDTMTKHYEDVYGKQSAILGELTKVLQPIVDKGPSQRGFSDAEHTALETTAKESTANNFAQAETALNENIAARGGSDFLPSGADLQLKEGLVATGAAAQSQQELGIETADWEQGRSNWQAATGALGGVANQFNPNGTASVANESGSAAGTTANQIAEASNSMWGSVIGGLSGIAGSAVGGWAGKVKKP